MRRIVTLFVISAAVALLSLPALAQEGEQAPDQVAPAAEIIEPAVVVSPPAPGETEAQWTYKFLVPLGLLIAGLIVFMTVVQYFVKVVRSRYAFTE